MVSVLRKHLRFCNNAIFFSFLVFRFQLCMMKGEEGCAYRTTKARMVAEVLGVDSSCEVRSPPKDCAAQRAVEWQTHLLSPPTRPMEPNVGRPKGLGNISDIRCRIYRHWFIIARAFLCSVFAVRVNLSNVLGLCCLASSWGAPWARLF